MIAVAGVVTFFGILVMIVYFSEMFNRRMPLTVQQRIALRSTAPANYDNRWPGYPLRPGDEDYDLSTMGDWK